MPVPDPEPKAPEAPWPSEDTGSLYNEARGALEVIATSLENSIAFLTYENRQLYSVLEEQAKIIARLKAETDVKAAVKDALDKVKKKM